MGEAGRAVQRAGPGWFPSEMTAPFSLPTTGRASRNVTDEASWQDGELDAALLFHGVGRVQLHDRRHHGHRTAACQHLGGTDTQRHVAAMVEVAGEYGTPIGNAS